MRTGNPGHLKAFDYLGQHRYSLTFCTRKRATLFVSADRVDLVLGQILRASIETRMAIIVYCFMPDHAHVLTKGSEDDSNCLDFIKRAKQYSGFHFKQQFGRRLWQRYGFERVLRNHHDTLSVARYIVENPVRAGLVEKVTDYPFVGSMVYTLAEILEAVQMTGWDDEE